MIARLNPFRVGAVAITLTVLVLRLWSVSRWSWMFDDWVYMERAHSMGLGEFLFQNYNGHVMPGGFLVVWLVTAVAPLEHGAAVLLTALAAAAATAIWAFALREVCGERVRTLIPLALIALTPLQIQATIWWAAALQTVSLQLALGGCVLFASRLARRGGARDRLGLLLSFAAGLLMWEKALLLLIPVAAVLVYLAPRDARGRWRRLGIDLGSLGLVAGAYAVLFAVVTAQPSTAPTPTEFTQPSVELASRSFADLIGHLLAPGLLGGPWATLPTDESTVAHPAIWQVALTVVVLALAVVVAVRRRRSAWVPLAMVVVYATVSWGLVVLSRLDILALTKVGYERYAVDTFVVACLALALLLAPEAARDEALAGGPSSRVPNGRLAALPAVLLVVLLVSLGVANLTAVDRIGISPARTWVRNLTTEADAPAPVDLVDALAPDDVLFPPFWGEHARLSRMLSPLDDDFHFDGPADHLYLVSPDGRVAQASVTSAIEARSGPVADCGYAVGPGQSRVLRMTGDLDDYRWGVQVQAFTAAAGGLVLELDDQSLRFSMSPGLNAPQAMFVGPVDHVRVTSTAESGVVCVTGVVIGSVEPAPEVDGDPAGE